MEGFRFPGWYRYNVYSGDWPLLLFHVEGGKLDYLKGVWSAYRVHRGGLWSGGRVGKASPEEQIEENRKILVILDCFEHYFGAEYRQFIQMRRAAVYLQLAIDLSRIGDEVQARKFLAEGQEIVEKGGFRVGGRGMGVK